MFESLATLPSHDELVAEQTVVQKDKFQGRLLAEYNTYVFPGKVWRVARSCAVTDLLEPIHGGSDAGIQSLIKGMYTAKDGQPVEWVDMGGAEV